ncbi:MAG: ATP-dependent ligase [Phenylobacterium sp.]|uniref:ATP-dependent DNA ligase n=1 Tax=Phenylobacterium sp. TaxID=1871053 RepID=UPI0026129318|nr:ATP-dependent DNA ligase [Phenylobacterium sp.]MDB5498360.1 ATP-dependent ligase [Phenylobacterium sp.]
MPTLSDLPVPLDFAPMEAKLTEALPTDPGWRFEPKWDGFRCLAFRAGDEVELRAKSGKPLGRYFPDMVAAVKALPVERFVVDGELTISVNGELSFDALQMRLHPAESRVRKLAAETPATLVLFDCLADASGRSLVDAPLTQRRAALEALFARFKRPERLRLSPGTEAVEEARAWLAQTGAALDGVVAKRLDGPYVSGERAMLKIKRMRTADCVVGGFRYQQGSRLVGSLLLGLYDAAGKLDHVGFTSTITDAERPALTRRLEKLAGGPGFTGSAPGGPSRWSGERSAEWTPLKPELVAEVRYDHVTGDRFRHGTKLIRWRPDKAPRQCTFEQLRPAVQNPAQVLSAASAAS